MIGGWKRVTARCVAGTTLATALAVACGVIDREVGPGDRPADAGADATTGGAHGDASDAAGGNDGSGGTLASSGGAPGGGSGGASATGGTGAGGSPSDSGAGGSDATGGTNGSGGNDPGAGGTNGSGGAAPEPSCRDTYPGAIFCEDFEDADLPAWSPYGDGVLGQTSHETVHRHSGDGGLYSTKSASGDGRPLFADALGNRSSGHLYLRAWMYIQSPLPGSIPNAESALSTLVLGESSGALGGISLVLWGDGLGLNILGTGTGSVKDPGYVVPNNAWLCVQVDFAIAAAATPRIRINGTTLDTVLACPAGTSCDMRMPTSYDRLWLGLNWSNYTSSPSPEVHYDDIVVDDEDVPCDVF